MWIWLFYSCSRWNNFALILYFFNAVSCPNWFLRCHYFLSSNHHLNWSKQELLFLLLSLLAEDWLGSLLFTLSEWTFNRAGLLVVLCIFLAVLTHSHNFIVIKILTSLQSVEFSLIKRQNSLYLIFCIVYNVRDGKTLYLINSEVTTLVLNVTSIKSVIFQHFILRLFV